MLRKMKWIVRFLLNRRQRESELDIELRFHIENQTEQNVRRGMTPAEARRAAALSVGGLEQVKEECRDARLGRVVEATLQDVRYGLRVLLKNPGFALTAIITLALGIGVNTAVFSVVYGVLLRSLPYQNGSQLVVLHQSAVRAHVADVPFSPKEILDYRDHNHTLQGVVEHHTMDFLLLGGESAERVQTAVVSANFFDVLGVRPLLGRTFVASDDAHGADAVLVLSYKYWQSRYGGDPRVVGRVFQMNNKPHTVIGVLPPIPQYPTESDVYMPTSACPFRSSASCTADRNCRMMTAFGRLKDGVALSQAQADLSTIASRLERSYPDAYPRQFGYGIGVAPLRDDLTRRARVTFLVLLAAAGMVLLIACANVANMLLARLLKVEQELAVRAALGASKARLTRQLLTESVMLSLAGGLLGLLLAPSSVALLAKFAERFTTRANEIRVDGPVLLFAFLIALVSGILFGLAPAFSGSRFIGDAFNRGASRSVTSRRHRLRTLLVVAQVAVSFMQLIGAGLTIRSFLKLQQVNPGFSSDRLLTMRLSPSFTYETPQQITLAKNVLRRIGNLGAVQSVALASNFPFNPGGIVSGPGNTAIEIEGQPLSKGDLGPIVDITIVSPAYFSTIRQPVAAGRDFTERDDAKAQLVAIVNQTMARHRWRAEDPIGKRISFNRGKTWSKIVGIVGDVREYGLDHAVGDEIYLPLGQAGFPSELVVRTAVDPAAVTSLIRAALHDVDPQMAVDQAATVERLKLESFEPQRVIASLLGIFAILATLISASGIGAALALSVSQRRNELGIRMALGAQPKSVLQMVVRQGLGMAVAGIALGVIGASALTRLLASLLYAISPTDLLTFAGTGTLFLVVAAVACLIPARQVTLIDPVIALRQE